VSSNLSPENSLPGGLVFWMLEGQDLLVMVHRGLHLMESALAGKKPFGNSGERSACVSCMEAIWHRAVFAILVVVVIVGCGGGSYEGYKYRPYSIRGVRYHPMHPRHSVGFVEEGIASHYDESRFLFFPGKSAIGEKQWNWSRAAAHKTLPLPCYIRVTNLRNGRSTKVRVNDRGPFIPGRILDVTPPVAKKLGFFEQGLTPVRIEVLSVGDGRHRIR
jgi:rare lipoprotein A